MTDYSRVGYMFFAIWLSFLLTGAAAGETNGNRSAREEASTNHAEYIRLSQELEKLSKRNAWAGVERTYQALVRTNGPLNSEDYKIGAHSAQALGKMSEARDRLQLANQFGEDIEVIDWLWDIESNYGRVFLAGDPGTVTLECAAMPFNPIQAKSVQLAIQMIGEEGTFDGLLPQGQYFLVSSKGRQEVHVMPRIQNVRIDLRTEDGIKRSLRKQRKEERGKQKANRNK